MPRFEPFPGVRYDLGRVDIDDVVAPPYDVVDATMLAALEARSRYNVVHVDLAHDGGEEDPYAVARCRFDDWLAEGVLRADSGPAFYGYAMGYRDPQGVSRQIVGVMGALEVSAPGEGDVLPHEETQHKVLDDRLNLLRACRADLSPVWGLSLADGLGQLVAPAGPPVARCTDDEGVHHRLWRLDAPALVEAVAATVSSAPVVIADGHHRYQTALAYRDERRARLGSTAGDDDLLLALVCELADGQAGVRPIHRVVSGLPPGFDPVGALESHFDVMAAAPGPAELAPVMASEGALGLVLPGDRARLLRPRPGATGGEARPDAALVDEALAGFPAHRLEFDPDPAAVASRVDGRSGQVGLLLRPVSVAEIAATALAGRRMPTKTTFFHPKPRTGMVFRRRPAG